MVGQRIYHRGYMQSTNARISLGIDHIKRSDSSIDCSLSYKHISDYVVPS